ncbi:MAG: hypothetical protein HZB46_02460 [Solirubrobacterales bacterium]|nr:hypothetical protein [Solirubrobacterales bacterium]
MPEDQKPAEDPPLTLDAEAQALRLAKYKAEARKAIAAADAGLLYQPKATPVKGETTIGEKAGSLLGNLALRGIGQLGEHIAIDVDQQMERTAKPHVVLIVSATGVAAGDAAHAEITTRLDWFAERFAEAQAALEAAPPIPQPQPASGGATTAALPLLALAAAAGQAGAAGMSVLGLAADVVSMFKSDYAVTAREISVEFEALAAVVARELRERDVAAVVDGFHLLEGSETLAAFGGLQAARWALEETVAERQALDLTATADAITALRTRIGAVGAAIDKARAAGEDAAAANGEAQLAVLQQDLAAIQTAEYLARTAQIATAKALIAAFDGFAGAITKAADGATTPLVAAALRDVIHHGVKTTPDAQQRTPIGHLLYLSVSSSGGEQITRTGLFANNERLGLVASVQATYLLADATGVVLTGGSDGAASHARFNVKDNRLEWP